MVIQFLFLFLFCFLRSIAYDYRLLNQKKYSMVNPLNENEHLTLVHIKKIKLKSCLQAAYYGSKHEEINININGTDLIVKCDQTTDGGGWTRILDRNEISDGIQAIIPIDDLGLFYTQLLFKAKSDYMLYFCSNRDIYKYDSYFFTMNRLKFDDIWQYISPYDVNVITPSEICFSASNYPEHCAGKECIFSNLPNGKLNAFSETESIGEVDYQDNYWNQKFELYVR